MALFSVPKRAGREQDSAIAKKTNSKTRSATTIKGSGLLGQINQIKAMVEKNLGKFKDDYLVITDTEVLHDYIQTSLWNKVIAIDTETTGLDPLIDEIVGICIYTPDGQELIKGLYVRVLYAYMAYQKSSKTTNRYVEEYDMYLCSSELDAVTFHNLSISDKLTDSFGDLDETTVSMYKHAETIQSGKGTVTGFEIDTTLNPTVKYTVEKDGKDVTIPENHKFTENGRYTININSAVGDKKTVTIYVDKF